MRSAFFRREGGQIFIWLAVGLPLLILFAALALDLGIIYYTDARLCNAVDAAALTGAKNFSLGTATAQELATDMFQANFPSPATLTFTWCPASAGCVGSAVSLTVKATTTVNTTFMSYLPSFAQWHISDTATATRSTLVMSLVLDRSGSMSTNGGGTALQSAVPAFVADFVQGSDYIGMVSFADNASVDVPITTNFRPAIPNAVAALNFNGGTFGTGAGTNASFSTTHGPPLSMADYQNNTVTLPAGEPETKVAVYFTDGLMNEVQDTLNCTNSPPGATLYNFGGYDDDGSGTVTTFDFFNPTINTHPAADLSYFYAGPSSGACTGGYGFCNGNPPYNLAAVCQGVTQFYSQKNSAYEDFNRANITAEAQWRALYTAHVMRNESPVSTFIYVIGLGHAISDDTSTKNFLGALANDPNYPGYDSSLPQGLFLIVPDCPSSACTNELNTAFQTIAAKVLLRLSR